MTERPLDARRIAAVGLASGALYFVVYVAGRAIFRNGQRAEVAGKVVLGTPPDGSRLALELGAYWGATVLLFVLYAWVLAVCHGGMLEGRQARRLALVFPVLFNVGLLFGRPYQSVDSLTYVAHGFMGGYGLNPHTRAAAEIAYRQETAELARQLAGFGWLPVHGPSPYGALWTWVEVSAASLTGSAGGALFLTKIVVVGASLGCAALIWAILGRVHPRDQLPGTLAYLWNPLIVVEFAAEGHNDALMVLCVLASLLFTVAARPALSAGFAVLGVLVKFLPVIFAPAQGIYLWRNRRGTGEFLINTSLALGAGLLLASALYGPFWTGAGTFEAVRQQGAPSFVPTPNGLLYWTLAHVFPRETASDLTTWILALLLLVFVMFVGWRARSGGDLLRGCAWISLLYLLVVSAGTWPWYAALPLALAALTPRGFFVAAAFVLTLCSRLVAPASTLINNGFASWDTLMPVATTVSVTVPLALLPPLYVIHRRRAGKG